MTELATDIHPERELAHHFTDLTQQSEASTLGMWLFLATEVMLFGAIFAAYAVYRLQYFDAFAAASGRLYVSLGTINTAVLLTSSLMMAFAVHAAHEGDSRRIVRYLLLTIVLGTIFLCIKFLEYSLDYREGLVPLEGWWKAQSADPGMDRHMRLFFIFYFAMTMLHAIHMTIGMAVLAIMAWLARKNRFSKARHDPVDLAGLYWHFVDVVWVFLFPVLYLVRPEFHFHK